MYDQAGQGFLDSFRDIANRLDRLERITSLFIAPVVALGATLEWTALQRYLDAQAEDVELHQGDRRWRRDFTRVYIHAATGIRCDFSNTGFDPNEEQRLLREAVLTVAACEQIMPMRLVEKLWPDQISAVDLLAEAGREPGT